MVIADDEHDGDEIETHGSGAASTDSKSNHTILAQSPLGAKAQSSANKAD
jgi:hypothetical protein